MRARADRKREGEEEKGQSDRERERREKRGERKGKKRDREVTCSHANDNAVEHSGPPCQRSANGHESRRVHVRLNVPT